ncbi:mitochondrial nucleotide exchange factor MGE1 [Sporobolomyces koalae]|uniref:mitochondrial nucleotide exchange factor MGE1 n=1 Tax=Sporobolomyces koalae TaxID=500713 RepID=UPI003177087B
MLAATRTLLRTAATSSTRARIAPVARYSTGTTASEATQEPAAATEAPAAKDSTASTADPKLAELNAKVDQQSKTIAELKDARLRSLADFENLQKISTREKQQAKDFALTSFAKDLVSSIDILHLALKSITAEKLAASTDLKGLHEGVSLTKREIEKVLARHGVNAFDPTGEQFDPNRHEALYQAPVPGKEPGSVLECQEIGYTIKDRLLRPAKVGVVLAQE